MQAKCEICGTMKDTEKMIVRRLNGRYYRCCGLNCEVQWEKVNLVGVCG